jgi:hypothetical protein
MLRRLAIQRDDDSINGVNREGVRRASRAVPLPLDWIPLLIDVWRAIVNALVIEIGEVVLPPLALVEPFIPRSFSTQPTLQDK